MPRISRFECAAEYTCYASRLIKNPLRTLLWFLIEQGPFPINEESFFLLLKLGQKVHCTKVRYTERTRIAIVVRG